MIVSENNKPSLHCFEELMKNTDILLNKEAKLNECYFSSRNSSQIETDVYNAINECAINTPFEGTIQLISGASFPDIVANKFYGVEVKSTIKNHWKSIGSSILESTRNHSVERIFLTFAKLGKPVEFLSRPYEQCLSGISVTHYPRYQIDMKLGYGETIFDKIGISYDDLRKMDNPVIPVSQYYKQKLKAGESLWWVNATDIEETAAPPTVRLWNTLSPKEKCFYTVQGYALFPEILEFGNIKKYQRYALWLATNCGIINTNLRDQFSAGGRIDLITPKGIYKKLPAAFGRIQKYKNILMDTILSTDNNTLKDFWNVDIVPENRLIYWCNQVATYASSSFDERQMYLDLLHTIFRI